MKVLRVISLVLAFASSLAAAAKEPIRVSTQTLIENPKKYSGQTVEFIAYHIVGFESDVLSPTDRLPTYKGIWIDSMKDKQLRGKPLPVGWVKVVGRFEAKLGPSIDPSGARIEGDGFGHLSLWPMRISEISQFTSIKEKPNVKK